MIGPTHPHPRPSTLLPLPSTPAPVNFPQYQCKGGKAIWFRSKYLFSLLKTSIQEILSRREKNFFFFFLKKACFPGVKGFGIAVQGGKVGGPGCTLCISSSATTAAPEVVTLFKETPVDSRGREGLIFWCPGPVL